MISRNKIVELFCNKFPDIREQMENINHNYTNEDLNPYHMEGSVWTHTMMVMTAIDCSDLDDYDKKILLISGLFHDVGKVLTIESNHERKRVSFNNHEAWSVFMTMTLLKDIKELNLSDEDIKLILSIISLHGVRIDSSEYSKYLELFRIADKTGAIRNEITKGDYEKRKYSKPKKAKLGECVILTGLPCSGKSTYIENNLKDYLVLSRDNHLISYAKMNKLVPADEDNYNVIYESIHNSEDVVQDFNNSFNELILRINRERHQKVVVDMTMLSLKDRRKMMNQLNNYNFKSIVLLTELDITLDRNIQRENKFISDTVYDMMVSKFIMPIKEEGFNSVEIILELEDIE